MTDDKTVQDQILALTEALVQFRTTADNTDELHRCIDYIQDYFGDSFHIQHHEVEGVPSLLISPVETDSYDVLLHGHIDVVEAPEHLFTPERDGDRLYGRGTADMKAGVACLMRAMKDLEGSEKQHGLMIVADEEKGGTHGAQHFFNDHNLEPSFALTAEPNPANDGFDICISQKGILRLTVTADGKTAHAARKWKGQNAIEELIHAYTTVKDTIEGSEERTTTINLGRIEGGQSVNKVPGNAEMELDIRTTDPSIRETVTGLLDEMDRISYKINADQPRLDTGKTEEYVQRLKQITDTETGTDTQLTQEPVASDMRHASQEGIPAVKFGPRGKNAHSDEEYTDITSLVPYYRIISTLLDS